jgi:chaperone BCS1
MTDVDLLRCLRSLHDTYGDNNMETEKKKTIMIFEDIDCIFKERKSHDENKNSITFSGLLNALDGITSDENLICVITTNYKQNLDSALLRPGRIDYIMKFDYSTKEQIQDMYKDYTSTDDMAKIKIFYKKCTELNIKISTALLQQYLMKYIDLPDDAITDLDELKKMYEQSKTHTDAEETGLFQ